MNKGCKHWNVFSGLNGQHIIILRMRNTSNDENNSFIFATMLKGAEARMSENIISYIYIGL